MFPRDQTVDYVYQRFMNEKGLALSRVLKLQSRLAALVFAIPALTSDMTELEIPKSISQSALFVCRDRGKVIMRSDWTKNAMWFTVDARPDCFLIGHDTCSRGAFVLNAGGRAWGFCPEWKYFKDSSDYSLPCIDGTGQLDKAPFVKLQDVREGNFKSVYVSADLTYPYNWTWTTWADEYEDLTDDGYEHEPNDPQSFGHTVWWAPDKLHGERHVAFNGLYQWRKRFASVQQVFRSSLFVPTTNPFVIIADDVKKDEETHQYSWAMTTPDDVELLSYENGDAVLTEIGGCARRFLVRNLSHDATKMDCSFRQIPKLRGSSSREDKAKQLVFCCHAREIHFRFLLSSLPTPQSKELRTKWEISSKVLQVLDELSHEEIRIEFKEEQGKACSITVL